MLLRDREDALADPIGTLLPLFINHPSVRIFEGLEPKLRCAQNIVFYMFFCLAMSREASILYPRIARKPKTALCSELGTSKRLRLVKWMPRPKISLQALGWEKRQSLVNSGVLKLSSDPIKLHTRGAGPHKTLYIAQFRPLQSKKNNSVFDWSTSKNPSISTFYAKSQKSVSNLDAC